MRRHSDTEQRPYLEPRNESGKFTDTRRDKKKMIETIAFLLVYVVSSLHSLSLSRVFIGFPYNSNWDPNPLLRFFFFFSLILIHFGLVIRNIYCNILFLDGDHFFCRVDDSLCVCHCGWF